jgi:hypothetical protein
MAKRLDTTKLSNKSRDDMMSNIVLPSTSKDKVTKWLNDNNLHAYQTPERIDTELEEWLSRFVKADIVTLRRIRVRGNDNFNSSKFIYPMNKERRIFSLAESNPVTCITVSNHSLYVGFRNGDIRVLLIRTFEDKSPVRFQHMHAEISNINRDLPKGQFIVTANHVLSQYKTNKSIPVKTMCFKSDIIGLMFDSDKKLVSLESGEIYQLILSDKKLVSKQKVADLGTILTSTFHALPHDIGIIYPMFVQKDDLMALISLDFSDKIADQASVLMSKKIRTDAINSIPIIMTYSSSRMFVANTSTTTIQQNYNSVMVYELPDLDFVNEFETVEGNITNINISNSMLLICTTNQTVEIYDTIQLVVNFVIQFELQICRCVIVNGHLVAGTENGMLLSTRMDEWRNYCNICFKIHNYFKSKAILLCVHSA